jgi:hypothetical protein
VFKRIRRESPAAHLKVCALLVPRETKVEHSGGVKSMSDDEIERGIELIKEILAQREAGANAKLIEATAESVALPAPAELDQPQRKHPNRLLEAREHGDWPEGAQAEEARAIATRPLTRQRPGKHSVYLVAS